MELKEVVYIS